MRMDHAIRSKTRMRRALLRRGFSLIEVNLAILLVTIGLLTLFALFPQGLRESEMAVVDTHEAMFADHVLSGVKANAQDILDWNTWTNQSYFMDAVQVDIYPIKDGVWVQTAVATNFPNMQAVQDIEPRKLRYRLWIEDDDWMAYRKRIRLEVKSGHFGSFTYPQVYATDVFYLGM